MVPLVSADGQVARPDACQLTASQPKGNVVICRVSDADPDLLRYFSDLGLTPGTELAIGEQEPFTAGTNFRVTSSGQDITLGTVAMDAVWVVPARSGDSATV